MKIIWCLVPVIWSVADRFFCHFGTIFVLSTSWQPGKSKFWKNEEKNTWTCYHFTHVYHKWRSYDVWFLRHGALRTDFFFFSFWAIFSSFTPPNNLKDQNFLKMKKTTGDIIILHMCTKNYDNMMYSSWDIVCNRQMDRRTDRKSET